MPPFRNPRRRRTIIKKRVFLAVVCERHSTCVENGATGEGLPPYFCRRVNVCLEHAMSDSPGGN